MATETIVVRFEAWRDGKNIGAATSLHIDIPAGLPPYKLIFFIAGTIAVEAGRYAAQELLSCLGKWP